MTSRFRKIDSLLFKMANVEHRVSFVQHFDIHINERNLEQSVKTLISHFKKNWDVDHLKKKVFDDGISNKLIGYSQARSTDLRPDVVLVRIYGHKTELLIDRARELRNFELLVKNKLSPNLYCTFGNGFCYGFIHGKVLTTRDFQEEGVRTKTAKLIAELHSVKLEEDYLHHHRLESSLFESIYKTIKNVPKAYQEPEKQSQFEERIPSMEKLKLEVDEMCAIIEKQNLPVVFCHNDLLCANFIYEDTKDRMWLIDYEYGYPNYAASDIGNHFAEFAGVDPTDYSLYPTKEVQLQWLKTYLEEYDSFNGVKDKVTDERINSWYIHVNQFALVAHLWWGVWALFQSHYSEIEFDFLGYAAIRLDEYFNRKEEFLGLAKTENTSNGTPPSQAEE